MGHRLAIAALTLTLLAGAPAVARAQETPASRPSSPPTWYGAPTLAVDAVSLATATAIFMIEPHGDGGLYLVEIAAVAYAVGGPTNHLLHRRWGRAVASLLARGALPILGGMVGGALVNCHGCQIDDDSHYVHGFMAGISVGALGAAALDQALAFEPAERSSTAGLRLAPSFALRSGGGSLALSGRF